jgi:hypothetical protein
MPEKYSQQFELVHPEDREKIRVQIEDHFAGHTPMFDQEYRVMHVDTKEYGWLNSKGSIIERDLEGKPIRAAGFVFDIQKRTFTHSQYFNWKSISQAYLTLNNKSITFS